MFFLLEIASKMPFAKRGGAKLTCQKKKKRHHKHKIDDNAMNDLNNMLMKNKKEKHQQIQHAMMFL